MAASGLANHVFINCPFDGRYRSIFEAIVFAVHDSGFVARCALELEDSSSARLEKIFDIVRECDLAIHDISRTQTSGRPRLPRFNMPFELGVFLGARRFGNVKQRRKRCLVLDTERYRYQKFLSDIAGQDITAHGNDPSRAIRAARDWLSQFTKAETILPGGARMAERNELFRRELPKMLRKASVVRSEMTYNDYTTLLVAWLRANPD